MDVAHFTIKRLCEHVRKGVGLAAALIDAGPSDDAVVMEASVNAKRRKKGRRGAVGSISRVASGDIKRVR